MIYQISMDQAFTFRWKPHRVPDPNLAAPNLVIKAAGVTSTTALRKDGTATITGIPDRYRALSPAGDSDNLAGLVGYPGGGWYLYLKGHGGQMPVEVSHYDDSSNCYIFAEPLPVGIPSDATGSMFSNTWTATIPANTFAAVDRAGHYEITWSADFDTGGDNTDEQYFRERGPVRVVNNAFDTGLTARTLKTLIPQMAGTEPANRDGWQEMIDMVDIIGTVESYLPAESYADQVLGAQFRRAHALMVASHAAEVGALNLDPERLRSLSDQEFDRQARRIHWIDLDDDEVVDAAEKAVINTKAIKLTASSAAATLKSYTDGARYRPLLTDDSDR